MSTVCPVLVNFGAYADDDELWVVRLSDRTVRIRLADVQGQKLWQWLGRWCDGQNSTADLLAAYEASPITNVNVDTFKSLLIDLLEAGVLQDSAQVFSSFVKLARPNALWGRVLPERDWPSMPKLIDEVIGVRWIEHFDDVSSALPWHNLIQRRKSTYSFKDQELTLPELGQLLQCYAAVGQSKTTLRRAVPSAGDLYQLKLWLLLLKPCEGFTAGVYEVAYRADGAVGLVDIQGKTSNNLRQQVLLASTEPAALQHASAWLVVGADLNAIATKYRNLAYSHALIEAGALLQNLGLIASAIGVGVHLRAGFDHARLHELCHVGEATLLISAVMGVAAATKSIDSPSIQTLRIKMGWAAEAFELPFHIATARVWIDDHVHIDCAGRSHDAALAYDKALSEALERYAMMRGPAPVLARWGELPNMVHPHEVMRWKDFNFDASQRRHWVAFENLANGQTHYVLQDLCFSDYNQEASGASYCAVNTSGMACAPAREMALTLATLELVERDAFMRAWLTGASCQPMSMEMLDADTRALCLRFEARGCRVVLGLLPSAWAVVVMVFVQHEQLGFTRICAAADFDAASAAGKAMAEVAYGVVSSLHGRKVEPVNVAEVLKPDDHVNLYCQREYFRQADFLVALKEQVQEALPTSFSHNLLDRMQQAGLRLYACEVAMPERREYFKGGYPVVCRVVIPGLIAMTFGSDTFPLPEVVTPAWQVWESPIHRDLIHPFP